MEDTKKLIEKYKRELMELSKAAPRSANASGSAPAEPVSLHVPEAAETRAPRVIGYVTEESGEFPAVFDKFITEAVENNDIETVRSAPMNDSADRFPEFPEVSDEDMSEEEPPAAPPPDLLDDYTPPEASEEPVAAAGSSPAPERPDLDEMARGTGESISNFPVPEYATIEEFEAGNRGGGSLEFRVFAAREAMPIENAYVTVSTRINGEDREMFNARTNSSGETGTRILPAPSRELSQQADNAVQPFALYDATVEKDGYVKVILRDIPIFDGIQSIQSVAMIPELQSQNETEEITEVNDAK